MLLAGQFVRLFERAHLLELLYPGPQSADLVPDLHFLPLQGLLLKLLLQLGDASVTHTHVFPGVPPGTAHRPSAINTIVSRGIAHRTLA